MQILAKTYTSLSLTHSGYIAGSGTGIVTVGGLPSARKIYLLNAVSLAVERVQTSLDNGHYLFVGLDTAKRYVMLCRDFKKEYEPFVWDDVQPVDTLDINGQMALWQTWQ